MRFGEVIHKATLAAREIDRSLERAVGEPSLFGLTISGNIYEFVVLCVLRGISEEEIHAEILKKLSKEDRSPDSSTKMVPFDQRTETDRLREKIFYMTVKAILIHHGYDNLPKGECT